MRCYRVYAKKLSVNKKMSNVSGFSLSSFQKNIKTDLNIFKFVRTGPQAEKVAPASFVTLFSQTSIQNKKYTHTDFCGGDPIQSIDSRLVVDHVLSGAPLSYSFSSCDII